GVRICERLSSVSESYTGRDSTSAWRQVIERCDHDRNRISKTALRAVQDVRVNALGRHVRRYSEQNNALSGRFSADLCTAVTDDSAEYNLRIYNGSRIAASE